MLKYVVITLLLLSSCVTKKLNVTKTQVESHTDSSFVQKKDTSVIKINAISIVEKMDEIEVIPIDTTKPIIINDVKYFNATLKLRKHSKVSIDTSKTILHSTSQVSGKLIKDTKSNTNVKNLDKKSNYSLSLLWLLLIPLVLWLIRKFYYIGN